MLLSGYHLDFGSETSPVATGYVGAPVAGYSSSTGYGWTDPSGIREVVRSSGTASTRDFHAEKDATFRLDLPNGTYRVTPTLGDTTMVRDHMDVYLNGAKVASNLTAKAEDPYRPTYLVNVTDGKLTMRLVDHGGETVRWAISALDVVKATDPLPSGYHLDFGSATSPVSNRHISTPAVGYSSATGFGWIDPRGVREVVRSNGTATTRDFHAEKDATFRLDLPNGTYLVTPTLGDATMVRDHMDVYLNGAKVASDISAPAGRAYQPTYRVNVTDGKLTLRLVDHGGETVRWAISALDVVPAPSAALPVPTASAGPDQTVNEGSAASFQGTATGTGTLTYLWTFGDGKTASGTLTPKHTYADDGQYTVTLKITDSEGQVTQDSATILVKNVAPKVSLTNVPTSQVKEGTAITIGSNVTDSSADVAAGFKTFWTVTKNGNAYASGSGTMRKFTFTPNDEGTYVVRLKVTDKDGATSSTASATIVAIDALLRANHLGPYKGNAGTAVNFVGVARDNGEIDSEYGFSYAWKFGDGSTATGAAVSHKYASAGTYNITLTVTGRNGYKASTNTTATIGAATTPPSPNDFRTLLTNLLSNTVYGNRSWNEMASSGAWGVNAQWEQGKSSKWYIEQQRYGEDLILDGLLHKDIDAINAGFKVFDWGFKQQAADGSFAGTQDPFHSTSFFVAAVARISLAIQQSPYASLYRAKTDSYTAKVYKAAQWMAKPEIWNNGIKNNQPYTHRRYLVATAMGLTSRLVGGNSTLMNLARSQIKDGLSRQLTSGINPEAGGYDSSYQAVGLTYAQLWAMYFPKESTTPAVKTMIDKGLAWEHSRILSSGEINTDGNTRTGVEDAFSGATKTVDWRRVANAFAWGFQTTGNSRWQVDGQRVAEYYFKTY